MRNNTLAKLAMMSLLLISGMMHSEETYAQIAEPSVISSSLSHNIVTSITEDSEGYIWIGTLRGLNRYNGSEFQTFLATSDSLSLNNDHINCLYRDGDRLWIGTDMGVCLYQDGRFYHKKKYGFDRVGSICSAGDGYIIVASEYGLLKYDTRTYEPVSWYDHRGLFYGHRIWCMPGGYLWLMEKTPEGSHVTILNPEFEPKRERNFQQKFKGGFALGPDAVCLYSDTEVVLLDASTLQIDKTADIGEIISGGIIGLVSRYDDTSVIIGAVGENLYIYDWNKRTASPVNRWTTVENSHQLAYVDSHKNIWYAHGEKGFTFIPPVEEIKPMRSFLAEMEMKSISGIQMDPDGYMWVTSQRDLMSLELGKRHTVYHETGRIGSMLITSEHLLVYVTENSEVNICAVKDGKILSRYVHKAKSQVFSMAEGPDKRVWFLMPGRLASVSTRGEIVEYPIPRGIFASSILSSGNCGELFVTSTSGSMYRLESDGTLVPFLEDYSLNATCIIKDDEGIYWIGTGIGLARYDSSSGSVKFMDTRDGLPDNAVQSILQSGDGAIWFSTTTGIVRYDRKKNVFSNYSEPPVSGSGMTSTYLNRCAAVSRSGSLYFCNSAGISVVADPTMELYGEKKHLSLRQVRAKHTLVPPFEGRLSFGHNDNSIEFRYDCIDFESGNKLSYEVMLEGVSKEWEPVGSRTNIRYVALRPGKYTFRARVRDIDGNWCEEEISQDFRIRRMALLSTFAKCIYLLLAIVFVAGLWEYRLRAKRRQDLLELEKKEKELNRQHIDLLTNLSHELKTPLTMVYAPVQELLRKQDVTEREKYLLDIVNYNTRRLKTITEQLIDIGRGEREGSALNVGRYNLETLVQMLAENFRYIGFSKNISMDVEFSVEKEGWFDYEKVTKILSNLLSNAVKYSVESGHVLISVHASGEPGCVDISVIDDGIGVSESKRKNLFSRFERLDREVTNPDIEGDGIGLSYVMRLARLHPKSDLRYAPGEEGGSVFTLQIPYARDGYSEKDIITDETPIVDSMVPTLSSSEDPQCERTMLVVEDNTVVRNYLMSLFRTSWRVVCASDGAEALDLVSQIVPDVIISDVVMPHKNGYELCASIRENEDLHSVPFILLTAMDEVKDRIHGLKKGADAYIGKPFNPDVLIEEVETLYRNRRRIQEKVLGMTSLNETASSDDEELQEMVNVHQKNFIKHVHGIIDCHMEDENYNVNQLAKDCGFSYSGFYMKIKAMTGKTPHDFLTAYKMNVAMELLKTHKYNISEVSYKIGASSPANFSRSFKNHFGIPPSAV